MTPRRLKGSAVTIGVASQTKPTSLPLIAPRLVQQNPAQRKPKGGACRQGCIKLPDREPSRLAAYGNGLGCWTFWRLFAFVAAANRDGSRSDPELDAVLACRLQQDCIKLQFKGSAGRGGDSL